ncbi:ATP-dependent Lon protease [Lacrimispora xylanisolvens]|uniref:Lon protease n=1 Tax=Lacrimispora xylanisolvens TaxID=384636 RepID=A0A2S6HPB8_9FIRM|nr:endopeptidase La [Hungatella xylanolytica]PPK79235.1 ATP-dependent Lon protease [Hungatella xylanolytica]
MVDKTITMPVIALRGMTVLPKMMLHFDISREKSIAAVEKAMVGDQKVCLVTQRNPEETDPGIEDLYQVGTVALIKQLVKLPNNVVRVMVEGLERTELLTLESEEPLLVGEIEELQVPLDILDPVTIQAMAEIVKEKLEAYGKENQRIAKEVVPGLLVIPDLGELLDQVAVQLSWDYRLRQQVLESVLLEERYALVMKHLITEIEVTKVKKELQSHVKERIDKNQKDYILREQMKVIREELGEDNPLSDSDEYAKRLKALKADKEIKEKIQKEIDRFKSMPGGSQEANVVRMYLDTVLDFPWKKMSKDNNSIIHAQQVLDEEHYGLEKVKERILEYLAVRILTKKGTSPILCLVGPPGTGKTSIARSVAKALNKEYVRISLGGIRDEAEIRGHRKTYVGAMPGRIAEAVKQAGVNNPLMLLDEIDKVSSDYKGDTSSALLEVLDSEQNVKFRDHYIELPIDLSNVLFLATANTITTIPGPLLDRMEVIEINSYTENEKFHIAKNYLVKKQQERNGLTGKPVAITDQAIEKIIHNYTREAGVRNLERRISSVFRKTAREFLEDKSRVIEVTECQLEKYLGKEKVSYNNVNEEDQVGIVRGLAWTSVGGDTLQIEVNVMPGKGTLQTTGQMGDVMKESAQTALSYVRSIGPEYNVPDDYFEKHDIHLHIPEGAVPKDGPSAGITMATAMLSAAINRKVGATVAMTGEITLRGRVLPIGGLKEKILAARMAHVKKVLVPDKNRPDIAELSEEITEGLTIVFVKEMPEVLKEAFVQE